jgi:hypothetical protein
MKRAIAIVVLLMLGGCGSDLSRAAKRYETAERVGDGKAACQAVKDAMDAALSAGSDDAYREWHTKAETECRLLELKEYADKITRGY